MRRSVPFLAVMCLLPLVPQPAFGRKAVAPPPPPVATPGWRALVSNADAERIDHLSDQWRAILRGVPEQYQRLPADQGSLLAPDAARDHPALPPGSYRCRLVKLSAPSALAAKGREPPVKSFPDFFCYVRGEKDNALSFTKQTGTELPGGWLHRDGDRRLILIGARQREPGSNSLAYGTEPDRNVVGVVERIGPFRWRLTLPGRSAEAGLDIYELTPVPQEQQVKEPLPTDAPRP